MEGQVETVGHVMRQINRWAWTSWPEVPQQNEMGSPGWTSFLLSTYVKHENSVMWHIRYMGVPDYH